MARGSTSQDGTTTMQKLFAYAYISNKGNGTLAAIEAGYSKKTATEQASRLLTKVKVKKILEGMTAKLEIKAIITQEQVIEEYKRIGLFDIRTLYNEDNSLKSIKDLSDDAGSAISSIEVEELFESAFGVKTHIGNTVKIKLNGKISALDSIRDTMGWKGVTKVAATNVNGEDVTNLFTDDQVAKMLKVMNG